MMVLMRDGITQAVCMLSPLARCTCVAHRGPYAPHLAMIPQRVDRLIHHAARTVVHWLMTAVVALHCILTLESLCGRQRRSPTKTARDFPLW